MCTGDCDGSTLPDGPAGADGLNAFTTLTASFVQPAVGSNVTISVLASGQSTGVWAGVGQPIFIVGGGTYEVISVNGTNSLTVKNLYAANTAPAATIASGGKVSPGGLTGVGTTGAAGANGTNGTNGVAVIDSDVTDVTTTQTAFTTANKSVTIPANTWATVGDTVVFEAYIVANSTGTVCGVQLLLAGNIIDLRGFGGTSTEAYFGSIGGGYAGMRIKVSLAMSAAGTVTPEVDVAVYTEGFSYYAVPYIGSDKPVAYMARGANTTGLTFTGTNTLAVKMATTVGAGSIKMFFSQTTSYKK